MREQPPPDYQSETLQPDSRIVPTSAGRPGSSGPSPRDRESSSVPPGGPRGSRGATPFAAGRGRVLSAGSRGRGRGSYDAPSVAVPPRAASPLPPNVPTGPRSQTRYKDKDGNGQGQENLDYGSHGKDYHRDYDDDRGNSRSRKRRASPSDDYSSRSKRR